MRKTTILIAGQAQPLCDAVRDILQGQPDLQVSSRVEDTLPVDPLHGLTDLPDVLIVVLSARWEETLRVLASRPAAQRPAMIVIGPANDSQVMRRAMQAGVRDFFIPPVPHGELLHAVRLIGREKNAQTATPGIGSLTAVINAKGGSGASFIAANMAHMSALRHKAPVALLDLDLQFGALPAAFDLEQRNSLLEALAASEQLDPVALQGYMGKHASGVHLLSAMSDQLPLPWEIPTDSLTRLLGVVRQSYAGVIVDLPRQIDPLTSIVLSQATHVVLVMQQSLAHVRDAKRMLKVLTGNLGVARENILLVVNRHSDRDAVKLNDIQDTVNPPALATLPNNFRAVSESLNSGVPLAEFDPEGDLTRALQTLVSTLDGVSDELPEPAQRWRSLRQAFTGKAKA